MTEPKKDLFSFTEQCHTWFDEKAVTFIYTYPEKGNIMSEKHTELRIPY